MTGLCLDTGALIALERRDSFVVGLMQRARLASGVVAIPAGVLAQAWRGGGPRQARLARFLAVEGVTVVELDEPTARAIGELCALTGGSDVVDAHVALHARLHGLAVITSDPDDLAVFGPGLEIVSL